MQSGQLSRTAAGVALTRAIEQLRDPSERLLDDPFAVEFVRDYIGAFTASALGLRLWRIGTDAIMPGMTELVAIRGSFADALVRREASAGVEQYLVLGAGFDTAALRLLGELPATRIFEVDHPDTQAAKRVTLSRMGASPTASPTFVAVDFERDDLVNRLVEAGFDAHQRSVVTWMGVSYYLTQPAIEGTLDKLARILAPDSLLAFDYVPPSVIDGTATHRAARVGTRRAAKLGEPFLFGIERPALEQLLAAHGFELADHLTSEEMASRYASPRRKMVDFVRLAVARRRAEGA